MISHTGVVHSFLFPSLLWRMESDSIYLTFDDGPHPAATPAVLKMLKAENIKATFFLTGSHVREHPSLVRNIFEEGHTLAIHGYTHRRSLAFSKKETVREILETEDAISKTGSRGAKLFRPPFGFFLWTTLAAAKALNYKIVMWTTLTGDFRRDWSDEKVVSTALSKLSGGSILVLHDNELTNSRLRNILPEIIARIRDRGFTFQAIKI